MKEILNTKKNVVQKKFCQKKFGLKKFSPKSLVITRSVTAVILLILTNVTRTYLSPGQISP